ncbi:glycosyltransferase family protein [Longilinea arvoryzae]|uniref:hypothetical protein n=1 Tax=Longilinea arvoryzae TaxID=360412 RepID=UPI0012603AB9|nr:hypothetical protein [Longilinea arvoryzae]
MSRESQISIAYFISPHGFGHAARASAVIEAIQTLRPDVHFHLFTTVPEWFFRNISNSNWTYHSMRCDIGLVQKSALREDVDATLRELGKFLPFSEAQLQALVDGVRSSGCKLVLCDIAPLGLAVAKKAGLPSVLIENFTWDWIYAGYPAYRRPFQPFIDYLAAVFQSASRHVRTQPFCESSPADLVTRPVSRKPRAGRAETRKRLGIGLDQKAVLITMGGIPDRLDVDALKSAYPKITFVVPGGSDAEQRTANLILLPHEHAYFHPDLVAASDAVLGKVGYSTIAEVYWAGVPFAYVSRQDFRESPPLTEFIRAHIPGFEIEQAQFENGAWQRRIGELLEISGVTRDGENGADQISNDLVRLNFLS